MEIENIDQAIEHIEGFVNGEHEGGDSFSKTIQLANSILDDPSAYTGPQAATTAIKLATHRYKIGLAAQYWKIEAARTKKLSDRLIKDALMVTFTGLEEVINTLKLTARSDINLASAR